jgi:hypothetical protein
MSYTIERSGITLKITNAFNNQVQYLTQPNVTLSPAQVNGNPIDSVIFKGNGQIVSVPTNIITSINGVAPAGTLDGIMEQIMTLLATTTAAPALSNSGHTLVLTDTTDGANYVGFPDISCTTLILVNETGTSIDVRQGANKIIIRDGKDFPFEGIYNANELEVRRTDRTNVQVTVHARYVG